MNQRNSIQAHRIDTLAEERMRKVEERTKAQADVVFAIVMGLLAVFPLLHWLGLLWK